MTENGNVTLIGKLNTETYRVVSEQIQTDDVVITDERIRHIKDRHPNDYEKYARYMRNIVENPQYILDVPAFDDTSLLQTMPMAIDIRRSRSS